jgi:hypothetical protein
MGSGGIALSFLTLTLDGDEWFASAKDTGPGAHRMGGWVGHRVGLDVTEKRGLLPLLGIEHWFSNPQPSCYTE